MKHALITGITGQDGSYLAELLLDKGYEVHGIIRRHSTFGTERIDCIFDRLTLHYGDMLDPMSIRAAITASAPDEIYNLAAQSHVRTSFDIPVYTVQSIAIGTLILLEAIRDYRDASGRDVRMYQASSSEMFGSSPPPQSETTAFKPCSPYACAKVAAFFQCVNYREAYGMFVANGILFNHESPRRGETFVTRKIAKALARIKAGLQDKLYLGNLDAERDWGYAPEYVEAMWRMLQAETADEFVIATGETHAVREFLEAARSHVGLDGSVCGFDERLLRASEVDALCGDPSKARDVLGWWSTTGFDELVKIMVNAELTAICKKVT